MAGCLIIIWGYFPFQYNQLLLNILDTYCDSSYLSDI